MQDLAYYFNKILDEQEKDSKFKVDIEKIIKDHEPKFYSWECLSLKLHNRTVDLVVKDELLVILLVRGIHLLIAFYQRENRDVAFRVSEILFNSN